MNLSWGVTPLLLPECDDLDDLFELAVEAAKGAGLVRDGDLVVITAGTPLRQSGTTNPVSYTHLDQHLFDGHIPQFVIVKLFEPHLVLPLQKSQFSSQAVIPHNSSEGFTSQQKLPGKRSGTATFFSPRPRKKRLPFPLAKSALLSNRFSLFPALHLQKQKRKRFPFCLRGTIITSRLPPSPER